MPVCFLCSWRLPSFPPGLVPSRASTDQNVTGVCRCRIVLVSCLCRIMELCSGVCIVGVRARVLACACARVLRRRRRTSLRTLETARPFSGCRTTGPRCEREGTRHAVHCSRKFFLVQHSTNKVSARVGGVQPLCNVTLAGTSLLIGNCFTYL